MRHFLFDIIFTIVCLLAAAWWGFSHGGVSGLISALAITAILAVMEISLSFDNAVVNASILKGWNDFWKKIFLTVGILVAVFGMRLIFPIVIVAVTANLGFTEVINLALNEPAQYAAHLNEHHAEISAFGGMFLLLVFLTFIFGDKEVHWFDWLERKLARFSKVDAMSTFVAIAVLMISLSWVEESREPAILIAGIWGILIYLGVNVLSSLLEGGTDSDEDEVLTDAKGNVITNTAGVSSTILKGGIAGFIYLEVLDASFSFDGVIGAFAITNDVIIIMLGLAIGAMFVRSMTLYLVDKGTLSEFVYLEHGAHYAIGALAIIMLLSMKFHVPELVTGLIGVAFIGLSLYNSIQYKKRTEAQ
ncbi:DUF475 domain-containing protein [Psychrobacter sanguinis]|uniref:DUF475 domain-containing protein n=1 Tax=Psychrobacter sanguinis TaxID=861445 RepID=UPI000E8F438A|nr:DUF475 domain-containing protein [Psychrobacter sanguinis]MDY3306854.1 DUF475 domain-containing protein [Psychrobacter sanguinis]UEC25435.1 DUF475 domain-containing protein [Psychrobacter sanguinis]HBH33494.1 hypothetical protein [Psychrobacter sp.]